MKNFEKTIDTPGAERGAFTASPEDAVYLFMISDLKEKGPDFILENLASYKPLSHNKIALRLISCAYERNVAKNLHKMSNLTEETAEELTCAGYLFHVVRNLGSFRRLSKTCADGLIDAGYAKEVAGNPESFSG